MPSHALPLGVTAVMLPELDFDEQLGLCRQLGVTHYSIRPRVIPEDQLDQPYSCWGNHKFDLTPERLLREAEQIRGKLDDAGIVPFGTLPAVTVESERDELELHFEGAVAVGAGRMRVGPLAYPEEPFNYADLLDRTVDGYRRVVELARPFNMKIVIETHSRSLATSPALAWNICRHFEPRELGVIFDIANFSFEGAIRPNLAVAVLNDYIDHAHVGGGRCTEGRIDGQGFRESDNVMCSMTTGDLHIPSWIVALHHAGRHVPLIIEDFTPDETGAERFTRSAADLQRTLTSRAT